MLLIGIHRRKHARYCEGLHPLVFQASEGLFDLPEVRRREKCAVVFIPSMDDAIVSSQVPQDILRPLPVRRYGKTRRRAQANDPDPGEALALDNGVRAVGGPQHCMQNRGWIDVALGQDRINRLVDAWGDILSGRPLCLHDYLIVRIQYHRISIRAADIDAKAKVHSLGLPASSSRGT